jgi:hypothetical protein
MWQLSQLAVYAMIPGLLFFAFFFNAVSSLLSKFHFENLVQV